MTTRSSRVGVGGPLARYSVRFDNELKEQGYREHPESASFKGWAA